MKEFMFKDCEFSYDASWLSVKALKEGCVYILKDGRIALYLGISVFNAYCFYVFCKVQFKSLPDWGLSFANYEVQLSGVVNICTELMQHTVYKESLSEFKTMPKIYCEFPFVNFGGTYSAWYAKSSETVKDLPVLASLSNTKPDSGYVGAKDLIPGHLYYTGACWRSVYVYLGRNSYKEFLWYFVGSVEELLHSTAYELVCDADTTKSNKKVKPLAEALNDPNATLWGECVELIKKNFSVDMTEVTQEMLNNVSNCTTKSNFF